MKNKEKIVFTTKNFHCFIWYATKTGDLLGYFLLKDKKNCMNSKKNKK